jgi:hypothetical protein
MEKIVCFETVSENLDPNGAPITRTEEDMVRAYLARDISYARRMTTCTEDSEKFYHDKMPLMNTYIVKVDGLKYLVYDMMYMIDADVDEDGEVTEIYGAYDYFVRPISEVESC